LVGIDFHFFGHPGKEPRIIHFLKGVFHVHQRLMRLRAKKNIRRRLASGLNFRDVARRPGVHVGAGRKVDACRQAESLIEGGLEIAQTFSPAESLGPGNEG
jgi:hypothetical protein